MVSRLSEISGLDAFTEDAMHVGVLEDVTIESETGKVSGVVLGKVEEGFMRRIEAEGGKGLILPYGAVRSVGDIVILKDIVYRRKE
jgi:sporulation protein YlmC with PRC-barrel domain